MGFPRNRRRFFKELIRVLLCCLILWILHQGWSWWNEDRSQSAVNNIESKRLDETLQRVHHLCSIAKEIGHGPSFSVCKQSKYGTLNDRDIVIVSLECKNLSFEEQLMKNYEGRVTVYAYCSRALSFRPFNRKTTSHRSKMIPVRPFFFRLDWLPYLGRHVWMKSVKQLFFQTLSSSNESVHFFRMGRLHGEPIVSAPALLLDLIENGALDHIQQMYIEIDIESRQDISDWIRALEALKKAQFSLYRSKLEPNKSVYVTSWMKTITLPTESLTKVNPLDPNANFADKLQEILTAPSVSCNRRLSIPITPVKPAKQLDFPALSPLRWPLCLEHMKPPCLVYSAKIGGSDDFEDAVARLGCEVFLFDPSLYKNETKTESDTKIRSFNWGLGNTNTTIVSGVKRAGEPSQSNGMWQYVKSQEIVRELGHEKRTIDVLKLDLHGGEWDILQNFLTSNTLTHIRQIIVSMHVWHGEGVFSLIDRFMRTRKLIDAGFGIFYSERMVHHGLQSEPQHCCHIVGWIRTNAV